MLLSRTDLSLRARCVLSVLITVDNAIERGCFWLSFCVLSLQFSTCRRRHRSEQKNLITGLPTENQNLFNINV